MKDMPVFGIFTAHYIDENGWATINTYRWTKEEKLEIYQHQGAGLFEWVELDEDEVNKLKERENVDYVQLQ